MTWIHPSHVGHSHGHEEAKGVFLDLDVHYPVPVEVVAEGVEARKEGRLPLWTKMKLGSADSQGWMTIHSSMAVVAVTVANQ